VVGTSLITWVEAHAALAQRRRAGELPPGEHRRAVRELANDWERYLRLEVTEALVREAATLAEAHRLRAYDSIHLASAVALRMRLADETTFISWDERLDSAAASEGLRTPRRR